MKGGVYRMLTSYVLVGVFDRFCYHSGYHDIDCHFPELACGE